MGLGHSHGHSHDHHSHGHDHGHGHSHEKQNFSRAFFIGISLNVLFVLIEAFYGYVSHSLALMADAGHNLSDVLGLMLAWGSTYLATQKVAKRFSYGLKGSTIMAATLNAVFLLVAIGGILWESVQRFFHPNPMEGNTVITVAAIGILVNGITAWLFVKGKDGDINIRGAFLHMLGDALVSVGVVVAGLIYLKTNWLWLDPVVSIGISIVIIMGTIGLLKESVSLSLQAVPNGIDIEEVQKFLESKKNVLKVHDLHIWAMSTTEAALTCHLITKDPEQFSADGGILELSHELEERFHIGHSTIQLDRVEDEEHCVRECDVH